jgi:hypothetical protein
MNLLHHLWRRQILFIKAAIDEDALAIEHGAHGSVRHDDSGFQFAAEFHCARHDICFENNHPCYRFNFLSLLSSPLAMRAKISGASALLLSLNQSPAARARFTGTTIYEALKVIAMIAESTRTLISLIDRVYRALQGVPNGSMERVESTSAQAVNTNKGRYLRPK